MAGRTDCLRGHFRFGEGGTVAGDTQLCRLAGVRRSVRSESRANHKLKPCTVKQAPDMRRKSFNDSPCAIARTLDVVGDWWTLLILRDAFEGVTRFNDFQRSLEVPKNVLSVRLSTLVERDILKAVPAADG